MDRRAFLITTSGAAAAAATCACTAVAETRRVPAAPSAAGGTRVLQLAMPWADNGRGFADSARRLANRIGVLSGGRFRIEVSEGPGAVPGDADLVHGMAQDLAPHHPAFAYFGGLPGALGLTPSDHATWLAAGGGQMLWDDLAHDFGIKPLLVGHSGGESPIWSRSPIRSLADLEGRKVYVPGLGAEVARGLGAEPAMLPARTVAEALGTGEIDAAEWGGLIPSMAAGLPMQARYAVMPGITPQGTALALHVRLSLWESLSETDRAIFAAAGLEELHACLSEARAHAAIVMRTLTASFGVELAAMPGDVGEALNRVAEATVAHVAGFDERALRIDQSFMAFRQAVETPGQALA